MDIAGGTAADVAGGTAAGVPAALPGEATTRAWALVWSARARSVWLRLALLFVVGLTPAVTPLVPLAHAGAAAAPVTLLVLAVVSWLPQRAFRGRREQAYRLSPRLRPLRVSRRRSAWLWLWVGLLALIAVTPLIGDRLGIRAGVALLSCEVVALLVLMQASRRSRASGASGAGANVVLDPSVTPEQQARVDALCASLVGAATRPPVPVLLGRVAGQPVNAFAVRRNRRWSVVLAPELLDVLDDRRLRALLAHEVGHTLRPMWRRTGALAVLGVLAGLAAVFVPLLVWTPLVDRSTVAVAEAPEQYGGVLYIAMAAAFGYLAFRLLWPLLLLVLRADEAAADRAMAELTGDVEGCVAFLESMPLIWGLPRRWHLGHLLLVAGHPDVDTRVRTVRAVS